MTGTTLEVTRLSGRIGALVEGVRLGVRTDAQHAAGARRAR